MSQGTGAPLRHPGAGEDGRMEGTIGTPPLQEDLRGSHGSTWPRVLNPVQRGRKLSSRRAVDVCSALTSARVWQVSRFCAGSAPNATRPDTYNSQMAVQIRDKEKRAAEQGGERWVTR